MNVSDITADTQMQGDVIVLKVRNSALNGRSLLTLPEFIHPHEVEEILSAFNDVSNDLILEYHYTRVDKKTLTVQALFKPVFTKLGESQKCAHFRVFRESERSFRCDCVTDLPLEINVPVGVDPIPVRSIYVNQIDDDVDASIELRVTLFDQVASYKNVHVVVGFLKKIMQSWCEHATSST